MRALARRLKIAVRVKSSRNSHFGGGIGRWSSGISRRKGNKVTTKKEYEAPTLQKVGSASQMIQGYDAGGHDLLDEFLIEGGPFQPDHEGPASLT